MPQPGELSPGGTVTWKQCLLHPVLPKHDLLVINLLENPVHEDLSLQPGMV